MISWEEIIFFFALFGMIGLTLEIFSTLVSRFRKIKKKTFDGHSSIWMFLMSGLVYFVVLFVTNFFMDFNILIRGVFYMVSFYVIELTFGSVLKRFKAIPWNYSRTEKCNFYGIICLEYAIRWYVLGIAAELLYFYLKVHLIF